MLDTVGNWYHKEQKNKKNYLKESMKEHKKYLQKYFEIKVEKELLEKTYKCKLRPSNIRF